MSGANASPTGRSPQGMSGTLGLRPIAYMASASILSWAGVALIVDRRTSFEVLFGMLGPLSVAIGTWVLAEWVYRNRPAELTGIMGAAFVVKLVFFGAYVAAMIKVMRFRPVPFIASFTGYFVALYVIEALFLRRLFSERSR